MESPKNVTEILDRGLSRFFQHFSPATVPKSLGDYTSLRELVLVLSSAERGRQKSLDAICVRYATTGNLPRDIPYDDLRILHFRFREAAHMCRVFDRSDIPILNQ